MPSQRPVRPLEWGSRARVTVWGEFLLFVLLGDAAGGGNA